MADDDDIYIFMSHVKCSELCKAKQYRSNGIKMLQFRPCKVPMHIIQTKIILIWKLFNIVVNLELIFL